MPPDEVGRSEFDHVKGRVDDMASSLKSIDLRVGHIEGRSQERANSIKTMQSGITQIVASQAVANEVLRNIKSDMAIVRIVNAGFRLALTNKRVAAVLWPVLTIAGVTFSTGVFDSDIGRAPPKPVIAASAPTTDTLTLTRKLIEALEILKEN